ncbi:hypothetical protein Ancab_034759 [Ancistrocladus abbreviatus]
MNRCDIQQNTGLFGGCQEVGGSVSVSVSISIPDRKGPVVCPKPRRLGFFASNPTMSLRWLRRNPPAELCDSKEGPELLDLILMKEGYGSEKSPREISSTPPFFCGSPPSRVSNPLVHDAQFGDLKLSPLSTLQFASPSSASSPSSAHKGGCSRMQLGLKPAAVRVEGFDCLSRDHQSSGITAVA